MSNLFNAIALTVGHAVLNPRNLGRFDWLHDEQSEVLANSNLAAADRVMSTELFCKAFCIKLAAHFRAMRGATGYVVVYAGSLTEVGSSFSVIKTRYVSRGPAERQAVKLSGRTGGGECIAITTVAFIAAARGVIRANMMNRTDDRWYVEGMGTPGYLSPSSEAYWSM